MSQLSKGQSLLPLLLLLLHQLACFGQQVSPLQLHLSAGPALYQGDLSETGLGLFNIDFLTYHGAAHYRVNNFVALGLQATWGRLSASDLDFENDPSRLQRQFRFQTDFTEIAASSRLYLFGATRFEPYAGLGFGILFYEPNAELFDNTLTELDEGIKTDIEASFDNPTWSIPAELGFTLQASELFSVQAGLRYHFTFTDYLDGISAAGDPSTNDHFGSLFAGMTIHFGGSSDQDQDGIADEVDDCPLKPGPAATNGCPDQDGDGIRDDIDRCPLAAGEPEQEGCPDTDGDGTADPFDRCPAQAGPMEALGCPPRDTDQDGVFDHEDDCPLEPGSVNRKGCPMVDSDRDGILDEDDRCPGLYGQALFEGCPDTDGDGIDDVQDACPITFGVYAHQGCPIVSTLAERVLLLNQQQLHFGAGEAEVTNYKLLDQFVVFLRNHTNYQLFVEGHSDGTGSEQAIGYLSQLRAERVKRYLLSKSIPNVRVVMIAQNDRSPRDTSGSPQGQAMNRRVQFRLVPF